MKIKYIYFICQLFQIIKFKKPLSFFVLVIFTSFFGIWVKLFLIVKNT